MYETIVLDRDSDVRVIRMNRPDRLNAWTYRMGRELADAVRAANADEAINGIVLTGNGRGFCAGADVTEVFQKQARDRDQGSADVADAAPPTSAEDDRSVGDWVALLRSSKPVVAAINGPAIGVGITQVLPMDFLLASPEARISLRFVKMGLVPELASSHYLTARMGFGRASELMLSGRTVDGEEAYAIGLIDRLVDGDALVATAIETVRQMGENPQQALRLTKSLLSANANATDLDAVQRRELTALDECFRSPEHHEAIRAFLEKRAPDFRSARLDGRAGRVG